MIVRVNKAKRRWLKWCRYIQKTNSQANPKRGWGTGIHAGQSGAYVDVVYAHRWAPVGIREPWYPRWGDAR